MCWALSIRPTIYWVDNTVRCGCLPASYRTPCSSASVTVLALVFSLAWLPVLRLVSHFRLSSIEHLVGWIITLYLGKDCFPPSAASLSEQDCIGFWASDSQSHLPFSSHSAKYSRTLAACVLPPTIQRLAVHALRVVSFGERSYVPPDTWSRPLSAAPSSITWTTPGLLRFAWGW